MPPVHVRAVSQTTHLQVLIEDDEWVAESVADGLPQASSAGELPAPPAERLSGTTLEEFESIALANNPTIQQLIATTQKAAGYRLQVGLKANPIVGYNGTQLADEGTAQHTGFFSREVVTGGKLQANQRVLNEALRAQLFELEAQRQRVLTDVRVTYFEALASQRRIELTREFEDVVRRGYELATVRKNAMEASQIEVLQSKIQLNQVELTLQQSQVRYNAAWRTLSALAGEPDRPVGELRGRFDLETASLDWPTIAVSLINESPEYLAAQTRVQQAVANLQRQGIQAIPNLQVQAASGYDYGTNSGLINVEVGAPIPLFNKNQGNIAAARADYVRASLDVTRVKNSIQARLAVVSNDYEQAAAAVSKYKLEIMPSAEQTLKLAEQAYRAGEFSFLEVLIVRRTYFDSTLLNLESQLALAQAAARVDGFVLTGGLDATVDLSGDDSLRGQTFSQQ